MLKFFVVDQCTQRHNKKHQPTCLDVFDKNLHALIPIGPRQAATRQFDHLLFMWADFLNIQPISRMPSIYFAQTLFTPAPCPSISR